MPRQIVIYENHEELFRETLRADPDAPDTDAIHDALERFREDHPNVPLHDDGVRMVIEEVDSVEED